jgi:hypothetical protein
MTTDSVTANLLDFSQDPQVYVQYLDSVVDTFYSTNDRNQACFVWNELSVLWMLSTA